MTRVKNEHYVPQSYLNYFGNRTKKTKENYQLNVYDKKENKTYKTNVDKVAAEGKYFHIPEELIEDEFSSMIRSMNEEQVIEKSFGSIEGPFKQCLDNIRSLEKLLVNPVGKQAINNKLKHELSYFLAIQFFRSKSYRNDAAEMEKKFSQLMVDFAGKETIPNYEEGDLIYNPHEDSAKLLQASFLFDPEVISNFARVFYKHAWLVLVNNTKNGFITSDNPIVKRATINDEIISHSGLASKGIEISFPISPNLLLMICERTHFSDIEELGLENTFYAIDNDEVINNINYGQVLNAERQVFSKDDNFHKLIELIKKKDPKALTDKSNVEIHYNGKIY